MTRADWLRGVSLVGLAAAACGTAGPPPAAPAENSARPGARGESAHQHYAANYWHEIEEDTGGATHAFVMPHCEAAADPSRAVFRPATGAAPAYGQAPRATAPRAAPTPLTRALHHTIGEIARRRGSPAPRLDAKLGAVARDLAAIAAPGSRVPYAVLEFAARHHGVIEASTSALVLWGPLFDPDAMAGQLAGELPALLESSPLVPFNRFGLAAVERDQPGRGVVVLVLGARYIDIEPLARQLAPGGRAVFSGRVAPRYTRTQIEVARDSGDRLRPALTASVRALRAEIACHAYSGRQIVTVTGTTAGNATHTLARFPIWCGEPAPRSMPLEDSAGAGLHRAATAQEIEIRLAKRINDERRRCGLDDLAVDVTLDRVARASMERSAGAAATDAGPLDAQSRVHAAGVHSSSVHEYSVRTFDLDGVVRELFDSFGYRAAILSPRTTHMGIAVVRTRAGRDDDYRVTQLFVSLPSALTLADVRAAVLARLAQERGVVEDSELSHGAGAAAEKLATHMPATAVVDATTRELRRSRTRFMHSTMQVWTGADIGDFRLTAHAAGDAISHYGLGIARGASAETGEREFSVVLILAEPKSGQTMSGADLKHR